MKKNQNLNSFLISDYQAIITAYRFLNRFMVQIALKVRP